MVSIKIVLRTLYLSLSHYRVFAFSMTRFEKVMRFLLTFLTLLSTKYFVASSYLHVYSHTVLMHHGVQLKIFYMSYQFLMLLSTFYCLSSSADEIKDLGFITSLEII
jgi:hypothetical protein